MISLTAIFCHNFFPHFNSIKDKRKSLVNQFAEKLVYGFFLYIFFLFPLRWFTLLIVKPMSLFCLTSALLVIIQCHFHWECEVTAVCLVVLFYAIYIYRYMAAQTFILCRLLHVEVNGWRSNAVPLRTIGAVSGTVAHSLSKTRKVEQRRTFWKTIKTSETGP